MLSLFPRRQRTVAGAHDNKRVARSAMRSPASIIRRGMPIFISRQKSAGSHRRAMAAD